MKGALRYVLRNLARRKGRAVIGGLGIFLTISLLTAIQIGLDSISLSYVDIVATAAGKADLIITAEGGDVFAPEPFDPAPVTEKLAKHDELRGLSPRLIGPSTIAADSKDPLFVFVIGVDLAREKELEIMGFTPEPTLGPGMCAISESVARRLKVETGSELTLGDDKLKVGTVITRQLVFPQQLRDYVVLDIATAREVLGVEKDVHWMVGAFKEPRQYYDARDLAGSVRNLKDAGEGVAADLGIDYEMTLPKASAITAFQNASGLVRAAFGVFALMALGITALLIYSLISVGVEERIHEFAILRTLGAKGRYIFTLVLTEALILSFLGVVPGVFAGSLVAGAVLWVVERMMETGEDPITLSLTTTTMVLSLSVGIVLAVASSLAPALAAVRRNIADALDPMRRGQAPPPPPKEGGANKPMLFTGLAMSILSVLVLFVIPGAFTSEDASLIGVVIMGLLISILLGFTLLGMGAMPLVERLVLAGIGWSLGAAREMAARNLARHRRRHLTTSLMYTMAVSFVLFIASIIDLTMTASSAMLEHLNGADIRVETGGMRGLDEDVRADLAGVEGVEGVAQAVQLRHRSNRGVAYDVVIGDIVGMNQVWITLIGADDALAQTFYAEHLRFADGDPTAFAQVSADDGGSDPEFPPIIISQAAADHLDVRAGSLLNVSMRFGRGHEMRFRVAAVCSSVPGFPEFRSRVSNRQGSGAIVSIPRLGQMVRAAGLNEAEMRGAFHGTYFVKAGPDQADAAHKIREEYSMVHQLWAISVEEQRDAIAAFSLVLQGTFGLVLVVAVVIAVFSLIASMATTVSERRWEIGVLKALGLRRGQLFRLFLGEAIVLTLSAGLAGTLIGWFIAYLFTLQGAALGEMPVVFTMPYLTVAVTFGVSIVAALVAAYLPTRRLLKRTSAEIFRMVE